MKVNPYANSAQGTSGAQQSGKTAESAKARRAQNANDTREPKKADEASAAPVKSDISPRAKEMALAKKVAMEAPDVRPDKEEKIAELKRRIANKEYNVSPEKVAERMVEEFLPGSGLS